MKRKRGSDRRGGKFDRMRTEPKATPITFASNDPQFGESDELAAQALVWALLLRETPRAVHASETAAREKLLSELENEARYWPDGPRVGELREQVAKHESLDRETRVRCEREVVTDGPDRGTRIIRILRAPGWELPARAVVFALTVKGTIAISHHNIGEDEARLPSYARLPANVAEAESLARSLAQRAVALVAC